MTSPPRVLFYTFTARAFQTTLIGHAWEIAQACPLVLLTEELPTNVAALLADRHLFPRLERMIPVGQFAERSVGWFSENRRLFDLARRVLDTERPDVVVTASDIHSQFDMYLTRLAKRRGIAVITVQPTLNIADYEAVRHWVHLVKVQTKLPRALPYWLRSAITYARTWTNHVLAHIVLPLAVGERPFAARASRVLMTGDSGLTSSDAQVVFDAEEADKYVRHGVSPDRVFVLAHHWQRGTREFLTRHVYREVVDLPRDDRLLVILLPTIDPPIDRATLRRGTADDRLRAWASLARILEEALPGWRFVVKPHPDFTAADLARLPFRASGRFTVVPGSDLVEQHLARAAAVVGFPLSSSTALYMAALQFSVAPKPLLSLDLDHELLGDTFAGVAAIESVTSEAQLRRALAAIGTGRYEAPPNRRPPLPGARVFADALDMVYTVTRRVRNPLPAAGIPQRSSIGLHS